MKELAVKLNNRSIKLKNSLLLLKKDRSNELKKAEEDANNLTKKGKEAFNDGKYYASSSYFFGANVKLNYALNMLQNFSKIEKEKRIQVVRGDIDELNNAIGKKEIKTITDLEAYMIVKERLIESDDYLKKAEEEINETDFNSLVYAAERVYSAYLWYKFFDNRGKQFNFNKDILKKSCQSKLSEAEERYQYLNTFAPDMEGVKKELNLAYGDLNKQRFELCLFKASKIKAEVDSILNLIGVEEKQADILIREKLKVIQRNLAKEQKKDIFPILGYSYYEYADSLKDSAKYSALLYLEYALELSNLDMYFREKPRIPIEKKADKDLMIKMTTFIIIFFSAGILIGFVAGRLTKKETRKVSKRR